jgi:hypothetical protein
MATAVVVATIVTTNVSEDEFKLRALDQIRHNDRSLLDSLATAGIDARVVTAIMDVDEFMEYVSERDVRERDQRLQQSGESGGKNGVAQGNAADDAAAPPEVSKTVVVTDDMSEAEFMEHALQQLRNGQQASLVDLDEAALREMEDEEIGEHFSRYPFQY